MYSFNLDYIFNLFYTFFLDLKYFLLSPDKLNNLNNLINFSDLHFSIQNPFLSFIVDIITLLFFFFSLIFIYIFCSWLWSNIKGNFKTIDEKYLLKKEKTENLELKKIKDGNIKHIYTFDTKLNLTDEQKLEKIRKIEGLMDTAGVIKPFDIPNLPIKEDELNEKEKEIIKAERIKIEESQHKLKDWRSRWEIVQNNMNSKEESLWRIAIMEADNLLSDLLSDRGYLGDTVSGKLQNAKFRTVELAWEVHKTRNRIAHDGLKFILSERIVRKTIAMFESVLIEFKVIE